MESDKTPLIRPFLLGVSGGTASGKTSVCKLILNKLGLDDCTIMSMDSFYKNPVLLPGQTMKDYNFDNPQALDLDLCEKILSDLLAGKDASIPTYDFCTHKRTDKWVPIKKSPIIIFEGIFALNSRVRGLPENKRSNEP